MNHQERGRLGGQAGRGKPKSAAHRAATSAACRRPTVTYRSIHWRLRNALPFECALFDSTCKGRLDVALRHDAPVTYLRFDPAQHRPFSLREDDYFRLCRSHHLRLDRGAA